MHAIAKLLTLETDKQKAEQRAQRDEEKRVQQEEKAAEKERARLAKEEKRKSTQNKPGLLAGLLHRGEKSTPVPATTAQDEDAAIATTTTTTTTPAHTGALIAGEGETVHDQVTHKTDGTSTPVIHTNLEEPTTTGIADTLVDPTSTRMSSDVRPSIEKQAITDDEVEPSSSPNKSRVKSWMKVKFSGRGDKQKETVAAQAVTGTTSGQTTDAVADESEQVPRVDSMRDVAMAGKTSTNETQDMYGSGREVSPVRDTALGTTAASNPRRSSSSVSSLYNDSVREQEVSKPTEFALGTTQPPESDGEQRGRTGLRDRLMNKIKTKKEQKKDPEAVRPAVTNTTDDEFEEARDTFEQETLEPPPALSTVAGETTARKAMSPKGSREGSRFTEEL